MKMVKISKKIIIITSFVSVALLAGIIAISGMILSTKYNKALHYWDSGHKARAVVQFSEISFYRDSNRYISEYEGDVVNALRDCTWTSGEISYRSPVVRHYTYNVTFRRDGEFTIHTSGQQEGFQYYSMNIDHLYRFDYDSGEPLLAIYTDDDHYDAPFEYYSFDYDEEDETISRIRMLSHNDGSRRDTIVLHPTTD